jgi:hypothetical protein
LALCVQDNYSDQRITNTGVASPSTDALTFLVLGEASCKAHSIAIFPAKPFPENQHGQICHRYKGDATGQRNKLRHQASSKAGQFFQEYEDTFPRVTEDIGSVSISTFA